MLLTTFTFLPCLALFLCFNPADGIILSTNVTQGRFIWQTGMSADEKMTLCVHRRACKLYMLSDVYPLHRRGYTPRALSGFQANARHLRERRPWQGVINTRRRAPGRDPPIRLLLTNEAGFVRQTVKTNTFCLGRSNFGVKWHSREWVETQQKKKRWMCCCTEEQEKQDSKREGESSVHGCRQEVMMSRTKGDYLCFSLKEMLFLRNRRGDATSGQITQA